MEKTFSATAEFFVSLRQNMADFMALPQDSGWLTLLLLIGTLLCAVAGYYLTIGLLRIVATIVEKTETDWDDDLINAPLLRGISLLTPALIAEWFLPHCFWRIGGFASTIHVLISFYIIAVSVYAANTFLDNLLFAFARRERFQPYAVKGIFQMGKLIFIGIGVIIALSLIVGKSPVAILTALGASAAILMLVFKDTIMGLVASVQLTANKMLRKGDWIIVPKHNANGEVLDISLTTIKIRNWDNSVTTVPPYSLISDSFQNFQAMRRSGGRRVCRPVYIDINSVRFLSPQELSNLEAEGFMLPEGDDPSVEAEDTPKANLRLFRDYLEKWIARHPAVRKDMIYMVRQLEPTQSGLPLELYFFLGETRWKEFEHLQSDIFNHVYASAPRFGLTLFQTPTGRDLLAAGGH